MIRSITITEVPVQAHLRESGVVDVVADDRQPVDKSIGHVMRALPQGRNSVGRVEERSLSRDEWEGRFPR